MRRPANNPFRRWARAFVPAPVLLSMALLGPAVLLWGGQQVGGDGSAPANQPEPRPGGDRRDRGGGPWRQNLDADDLTDEQIETLMLIVEAMYPDRVQHFRALREQDNRKFRRILAGIAESNREIPWLVRLRTWDPQMFQLQLAHLGARFRVFEVHKNLRRQYESTPAERDEKAIAELKDQAETAIHFRKETEFKIRQLTLDRWKQRLDEFVAALDTDKANLDSAVETELNELVRRAEAGEPAQKPEDGGEGLFGPGGPGGGPGSRDGQGRRGDGNRNN